MTRSHLHASSRTIFDVVLPRLLGRVFHVTSPSRLRRIRSSGHIRTNHRGRLGDTWPQSENGVGRQRNCVCLFDLRGQSDEAARTGLSLFWPVWPAFAFLFLAPSAHSRVVTPELSAFGEGTVIPDVEAWFPGDIPIGLVEELLLLRISGHAAEWPEERYARLVRETKREHEE